MLENVMHTMGGVNAFGIITICLFFAFFVGMIVHAVRLKKPFLNAMSELPLDDGVAPRTKPTSDGELP